MARLTFTVALPSHLMQIIFGLIAEYRLAKCVIGFPQDKVIAGDRIPSSHPLSVGDFGGSLPFRQSYLSCQLFLYHHHSRDRDIILLLDGFQRKVGVCVVIFNIAFYFIAEIWAFVFLIIRQNIGYIFDVFFQQPPLLFKVIRHLEGRQIGQQFIGFAICLITHPQQGIQYQINQLLLLFLTQTSFRIFQLNLSKDFQSDAPFFAI